MCVFFNFINTLLKTGCCVVDGVNCCQDVLIPGVAFLKTSQYQMILLIISGFSKSIAGVFEQGLQNIWSHRSHCIFPLSWMALEQLLQLLSTILLCGTLLL